VGEAGLAAGVVGGAGVDEGVEAEDGGFMALGDDERKTVGQDFDGGALLEGSLVWIRLFGRSLGVRGDAER
jgi:hypothetical protein